VALLVRGEVEAEICCAPPCRYKSDCDLWWRL